MARRFILNLLTAAFYCAVTQPLLAETMSGAVPVPATWQVEQHVPRSQPPLAGKPWWKVFSDPQLDRLIDRADAGNTSLAAARARLDAAQAAVRGAGSSAQPQLSIGTSADRAGGPLINQAGSSGSLFVARANLSWEVDLAGRISSGKAAASLDADAASEQLADTRLLMQARVASAYFRVRFLMERVKLAREQEDLARAVQAIQSSRIANGLASRSSAVATAERLSTASSDRSEFALQLATARRELAYLCGESNSIEFEAGGESVAPEIPAGIPAETLARRPDIKAAIAALGAADKRLLASRRSWLPSLSLTASGGGASASLGEVLSSASRSFGLGLLLGLPIFDGGRHNAEVATRKAELALASTGYRETILRSLHEVNDALSRISSEREQLALASSDLDLQKTEQILIEQQLRSGMIGKYAQLEASQKLLTSREAVLRHRFGAIEASLELIRSLGGGW